MDVVSFKLSRDLKLIALSNFIGAAGEGLYFYIWPLYILELNADPIYLGALISILYLISAITPIPGGLLADKYDRRKIVIVAWTMWATTPLLYSMAADWTQLLPGAFMWGFSMIGQPAFSAYIVTAAPKKKLAYVFSLVHGSWSLGYIFSPTLGGYLSTVIGMRGVLHLSFILSALCATTWFFISSQRHKTTSAEPKLSRSKSTSRNKIYLWVAFYAATTFVIFIPKPFIPTFLQNEIGLNTVLIGVLGSATFFGSTVLGIGFGKIGDLWRRERVVFLCVILCVPAFALLIFYKNFLILFLASFLIGGSNAVGSLISSIIGTAAPETTRARWMAVPQTASMIGACLAPYLGGFLYQFSPYYPFLAVILIIPLIAVFSLIHSERETRHR